MKNSSLLLFASLVHIAIFSAFVHAQNGDAARLDGDGAAVSELAKRYYYAYEGDSLEAQKAIWSPRTTDPSANLENLKRAREQWEKVKVEKFVVDSVRVKDGEARVRVIVNVSAISKRNGRPVGGWLNRDARLTHVFAREGADWKLIEIKGTDEEMVEELAALPTIDDMRKFIESNPTMRTKEFVGQLGFYGLDYGNRFGDHQKGMELLEVSLSLAFQLGDKEMESQIHAGLGRTYMNLGDHALALVHDQRHYELELELGPKGNAPNALNSMGVSFAILGDYQRAIEHYEKGLATKTIPPGTPSREARLRGNIGQSALEMGDTARAETEFQKVLSIGRQNNAKADVARAQLGLGDVAKAAGEPGKALELYLAAMEAFKDSPDKGALQVVHKKLAEVHLALKDFPESIRHAHEAVEIAAAMYVMDLAWDAHFTAARAHIAVGAKDEARTELEKSIAIIERMRTRVLGGEESQQRFFDSKSAPYAELAALFISEGRIDQAFRVSEQIKGRTLLSVLGGGRNSFANVLTAAERAEERRLVSKIAEVNLRIRGERDGKNLELLQAELERARKENELFRNRVYANNPQFRLRRAELPEIERGEIAKLAGTDTAIMSYVVGEGGVLIFTAVAGPGGKLQLKARSIDISRRALLTKVSSFRNRLASGDLGFRREARELYDLLVGPADEALARKKNVIIVPDDLLWELPFQALMDAKGGYLIDRVAVSYAPSLTALREMSKKAGSTGGKSEVDLLALGNPIVDAATSEHVKRVFMSEKLDPIPEAERLVNELGRMYGPKRSKVLTGAAAKEGVAKSESPKYRIVQLATHGILNNVSPMYSHLVFAKGDKASGEDGLLEAWELKDLNLNADMLILSACDTARGRVSRGEGMVGMTWAAFIAGVPTTVASQWKVESRSTTELMLEFHRQLIRGTTKAEAMRQASLKVKRMKEFSHPSYWAGFVVVGDGR